MREDHNKILKNDGESPVLSVFSQGEQGLTGPPGQAGPPGPMVGLTLACFNVGCLTISKEKIAAIKYEAAVFKTQ